MEVVGRPGVVEVVHDGSQQGGEDLQVGQPLLQRFKTKQSLRITTLSGKSALG